MNRWEQIMSSKTYEPKPRLVGGRFGFVRHRFPIKGGISLRDVMLRSMYCTSQWSHLFERRDLKVGESVTVKLP